MIQPRVAEGFARQGMMVAIDAELLHADAGLCRIGAPIRPDFTQQHGYGHAGITFALGGSAAGSLGRVLTAEVKITSLRPPMAVGCWQRDVSSGQAAAASSSVPRFAPETP